MSRNIKVATWGVRLRASVVFVHSLGGHAYDTWRRAADDGSFWPLWLAEDVAGLTVYTLVYEALPSNWLGHFDGPPGPCRQRTRMPPQLAGPL